MSIGLRDLFGIGLLLVALLAITTRVLTFLFWRRVRQVNPALWEARIRSVSLTNPISKFRFWTMKLLFSHWKSEWEHDYGSLDDRRLNRLAGAAKGAAVVSVTLWASLFGLAFAHELWSKF